MPRETKKKAGEATERTRKKKAGQPDKSMGKGGTMTEDFWIGDGILELYTGREELVTVPDGIHTIGEGAFKACVSMKKVVLPSGLRRIQAEAFKGCRKLEVAEIPTGVSYIGEYAFHRCHALKRISLPTSVEELGDCVFLYCDSLKEARIPGVRRLGSQVFVNDVLLERLEISQELEQDCICDVFTGCGALEEVSFAGGSRYRFPNVVEAVAGDLPLPELVKTVAVDVLRMMELDGRCLVTFRTNLKHVEIPEGIRKIGKSCFYDKRGILSVKLPSSLEEIDSRAFRNCINLEAVDFAREDIVIHEDAFKNCSSLKKVRTGDGALHEIEGLYMQEGENASELVRTIYRQVLGNFRISGTILLKYLGTESRVAVPKGITVIAQEAFAGNEAIDRVILPESLLEIGAGAFRDCLLLQSISFPDKLERIGAGAFENCVKLLRVSFPPGLLTVEERTFRHCRALKEIEWNQKVWKIGEQAFNGCVSLGEVRLPDSLTFVGEMAFYRCRALKEIRLLSGITYAGSLAFAQSGVKRVWMAGNGKDYGTGIFSGCSRLRELVLEEGVCHMADKLAYGCNSLRRVVLPDSLQSAGRNVWDGTLFLEHWLEKGQVTEEEIIWDGRNLDGEIWLSERVRIVAGGAFYGNERLREIHLPETVKWIGPAAFKGCTRLHRVCWPAGVKAVEAEVFSGCRELEAVEGAEWHQVGERAFYHCGSLSDICLEQTSDIGKEAFAGCVSLRPEKVKLREKRLWVGERSFAETAFEACGEQAPVVIGTLVVSGGSCGGEVRLPEGITGIAPFAFERNREITKVVLPESLERIGEGAFWGCGRLAEVVFPQRACRVHARAFEKCTALQEVDVHVTQLGAAAFACCFSLVRAEIEGVSLIAERLFEECRELEECICEGVRAVKANAFRGCRSLRIFDFSRIYVVREYAFSGCESLKRAVFRDEACVKAHGFEDCGNLEEIFLSGEQGRILLREYALSGCTGLRRVIIRGQAWQLLHYNDLLAEQIPEMARLLFQSALSCFTVEREENLTGYRGAGRKVKIPGGIRRIEAEVFRDVLMLEEIEIPESVDYIGARAFHGTAWMEKRRQESPMVTVNHMLLDGSGCVGEVVVPEDIRMVCGWAFANGMEISGIRFLSERVRVEEYAFRNCIWLEELTLADGTRVRINGIGDRDRELPALARQAVMDSMNCFKTDEKGRLVECTGNISRLRVAEGITAIGEGAFQDGNLLTEIILPDTVETIEKRAFAGCKWLREVRGAGKVREVGDRAFSGCGALEKVDFSERFCRMGTGAFENCTSLREILVSDEMEEIPDRAFYRCHRLREINLPAGLRRVGSEAFAFCGEVPEGVKNPGSPGKAGPGDGPDPGFCVSDGIVPKRI
ncbi:MAG: leucine-rich repeat protein [Lachnospiraceae bacterium]|nr:leucine-rich repeat protein [Lachnospiraceae bacterium]